MKRLLLNKLNGKVYTLMLALILAAGVQSFAQMPTLTVRFNNPQYDCPTQTYCLDVEFISDVPDQQLFGINVRFFYDDDILEYISMGDFAQGYSSPIPDQIVTGGAGSGADFNIAGPLEWFNGYVEKTGVSPIILSTSEWTKLFKVCFHVDDPNSLNIEEFCPTIVWDLEYNPDNGGYLNGDDGVVMTVVTTIPNQDSAPTMENVVQFNWQYNPSDVAPFGFPVNVICISTICGFVIPVSDWALFLGIGLMVVATLFIYRRRIIS
jgi:hypothetical protein